MSKERKNNAEIVYVDEQMPTVVELREEQELVIANSLENFGKNYMVVSWPSFNEAHFTSRVIAGIHSLPGMRDKTYVVEVLVAKQSGDEGEFIMGLGYAHIGKTEETKSFRYKILPREGS